MNENENKNNLSPEEKYFDQDPKEARKAQIEEAKKGRWWVNYLIAVVIGIAITILTFVALELFTTTETLDIIRIICDGFVVSGLVLIGVGALIWTTNEGTFDIIKYGVSLMLLSMFSKIERRKYKDFYEYREAKSKNKAQFKFLLIVGACFLFVGIVIFVIYKFMA